MEPVPHSLAWKYIAHARKTITDIKLSSEACQVWKAVIEQHDNISQASTPQVLKDFYMKLRRQGYHGDGMPITARQLESLKRLSQARAKVEMR